VAGIDPHKRTFTVAVLDERGGLHGVASFDTSEQGPTGSTWPGWPPPPPTSVGWTSASASSTSASPRCWRGIAAP
jgi:hypothetical protein